jgi:hypothetical protein
MHEIALVEKKCTPEHYKIATACKGAISMRPEIATCIQLREENTT